MAQQRNRLRIREAWRAMQRLRQNPDDTRLVFVIIQALAGRSEERAFQRFRRSRTGARVLAEERDLLPCLQDRAALAAMAPGSLGRSYFEFTEREQITAAGLVEASEPRRAGPLLDPERRRFFDRLRDMHDLQHVATGWGRDLRGEAALLTFGLAQAWSHGLGLIVGMAFVKGQAESRRVIRDAWRRGRRAAWLSAADWEALLPRPLDEVRRELRLGEVPHYEPLRSAMAPAAAA